MLNRILAVTALGLAVGLAACDQGGQEQAQEPPKEQGAQPSPGPQQGMTPEQQQQQQPPAAQGQSSEPSR